MTEKRLFITIILGLFVIGGGLIGYVTVYQDTEKPSSSLPQSDKGESFKLELWYYFSAVATADPLTKFDMYFICTISNIILDPNNHSRFNLTGTISWSWNYLVTVKINNFYIKILEYQGNDYYYPPINYAVFVPDLGTSFNRTQTASMPFLIVCKTLENQTLPIEDIAIRGWLRPPIGSIIYSNILTITNLDIMFGEQEISLIMNANLPGNYSIFENNSLVITNFFDVGNNYIIHSRHPTARLVRLAYLFTDEITNRWYNLTYTQEL